MPVDPQGPPLQVYLDGRAEYIEGEATQPVVLVTVFFYNPDEDTYQPQLVDRGTASLVYNGTQTVQSVNFDRRFGNSDGAIYFQFSNPAAINNLSVRIEADLKIQLPNGIIQESHLDKVIPVLREDENPIPLKSQSDTGSASEGELRSKKRLEEELL